VRMSVAKNTVVRRTKTADSQTICGSAIEHEKGLAVGFEYFAENILRFGRDCVRPVTDNVPGTHILKRFKNFRATPGVVITRKLTSMIETPHAHIVRRDKVACQRNLALSRRDAVPTVIEDL
jgi:hypothetical protein